MLMQTIACRTIEELGATAARIVAEKLQETIARKGKALLAIPGGRSVAGILRELVKEDLPWQNIHIFWADERKVPLHDEESNYALAAPFLDELVKKKVLPKENIHPYDYRRSAEGYSRELVKHGGRFDVALLSAGEDGHIASLFPKHDSFYEPSPAYIDVRNAPKLPAERISASKGLIQSAGAIVLLFAGKEKKKAYGKFMDEHVSEEECPAKMVKKVREAYILTYF